jgi:hypothetical protein
VVSTTFPKVCRPEASLLHPTHRGALWRGPAGVSVTALILLIGAAILGCETAPPPVTDPANAPWLLDPNSQIEGLKNSDFRIRRLSAFNLGNMGAKAVDAIAPLEELARNDPNPKVRKNAQEAIDKIRSASDKSSE